MTVSKRNLLTLITNILVFMHRLFIFSGQNDNGGIAWVNIEPGAFSKSVAG